MNRRTGVRVGIADVLALAASASGVVLVLLSLYSETLAVVWGILTMGPIMTYGILRIFFLRLS